MKKLFFLLLLFVLADGFFACRGVFIRTPSLTLLPPTNLDSLKQIASKIDVNELAKKYDGESGVYLEFNESVESLGKSDRSRDSFREMNCLCRQMSYVILKAEDADLTTFEWSVAKERDLLDFYVVIVAPDGTIQHFSKQDLKVQNNDVSATFRLAYPDIKKGSVVFEGEMINYYPNTMYFLQRGLPVQKLHFMHAYRDNNLVEIRRFGDTIACPVKKGALPDLNLLTYTKDSTDVPAWHYEPYAPWRKDVTMFYEFSQLTLDNLQSFNNTRWRGYAVRNRLFVKSVEDFATKETDRKTLELCKNCSTKAEKIDTIIRWIQKNIEAVSPDDKRFSDAVSNQDFDDIMSAGMTNSYGVLRLAEYMLIMNGIENSYCELFDPSDGRVDEMSPEFADHAGAAILCRDSDKTYLVFPHIKEYTPDFAPEYVQGARAVVIGSWIRSVKDFSQPDYFFITLNPLNVRPIQETSDFDLRINDEGNISVVETQTYENTVGILLRSQFKNLAANAEEQRVRKMLSYDGGDVKMTKYTIEGKDAVSGPVTIRAEYTINNLVTVTPEEAIFQTSGLFSPTSLYQSPLESDHRYNPIDISVDSRLHRNISVHYPSQWKLSSPPQDKNISNDLGTASVTYDNTAPGVLKITVSRFLHKAREPKEKLSQLVDLVGRRSTLQVPTLLFSTK